MTRMPSLVTGDINSSVGLVFLAGFPDNTISAWGPIFDKLKNQYKIQSLCFPDFEDIPVTPTRRWGYDFNEVVELMHDEIVREMGDRPTVLIVHDWGSLVGLLYQNKYPSNIKAMVIADVLPISDKAKNKPDLYKLFVMLSYQSTFALCYITQQLFGNFIGDTMLKTALLLFGSVLTFLSPSSEKIPRGIHHIKARMCYPYFILFKQLLNKTFHRPRLPNCPVLYMWGGQKNITFHSEEGLRLVETQTKSRTLCIQNGRHWFMHSHTEQFIHELLTFLAEVL